MSDNPPPKKKSRFFSNGMSVVDNILRPLNKQARKGGEGDGSAEAEANDPPRDGTPSTEQGPSLLSNIRPAVPSTLPAQTTTPNETPATGSAPAPPSAFLAREHHDHRQSPPPPRHAPDSEAETEVESIADRREDEADCGASDEENTKPSLHIQRQRHQRRQAIYGAEALLPQGSKIGGQQTSQPPSFIYNPHSIPAQGPILTAPSALAPPGNSYTFSGVPTNPNATTAGGQFAFNFRLTQDLPIPSTIQQPAYNQYQHPIGSGLARIAHQAVHADTGPLNRHGQQDPTTPKQPFQTNVLNAPYVDMDRDEHGRRLRDYVPRPTAHHGICHSSNTVAPRLRGTDLDSLIPEHMYTSPNRVERAQQFARINLKRKRPDAILPPASYVYQHTGSPDFNIFHGLLLYPELCFALAAHLPVKDLISLYAISKDFHVILDTRFTTVMLRQAVSKAPDSARTFMFRSYAHLCRSDPAARIAHPNAQLAEQGTPRKIPSFRWLKMVLHREKVIHELMTVFAEDGIPLPARCALALKRLWFMLDIPDNARRIGFVHNKTLMTDLDLYFCACFITKLDMRLNDPISGEKRDGMRKLLLAQRSFTRILRVLKREVWTIRFDVLREWVRMKHVITEEDEVGLDMFGVPASEIGRGRLEYWGLKTEEDIGRKLHGLLRPDQLIVREAIKRGMRFEKHYLRFLLYGYVRPDTLEDYAPRTYGRRISEIQDDEYEVDDLVGGVAALGMGDEGFDPLLDLGQPRETSPYTIVKEETSKAEVVMREREDQFLDKCISWWEEERRAMQPLKKHAA
ncbi:hypothetical protein G647_04094 [Cladophialophora carrionii CBS 160.54]|uniref:F-box domain-containing protein n=1 Tax=Cladophialophora carrionii CBS 160.54 TaxID=1279043 RepID=V9DCU5_9EURO|nr:uncharacterized protein G647_04094 [Cladophialophora carrionii CBS 160.54]ETI24724.1 hypothetical protein G647_04094 [Cladophialophora carrionii CBS 160.54]